MPYEEDALDLAHRVLGARLPSSDPSLPRRRSRTVRLGLARRLGLGLKDSGGVLEASFEDGAIGRLSGFALGRHSRWFRDLGRGPNAATFSTGAISAPRGLEGPAQYSQGLEVDLCNAVEEGRDLAADAGRGTSANGVAVPGVPLVSALGGGEDHGGGR